MTNNPPERKQVAKADAQGRVSAQPRLRVLAGPNGSGKSTIQRELNPAWLGSFINADEIEHELKHSAGKLNLARLGLTAKPALALRRMEQHIQNSAFAAKLGLHSLIGKMALDNAMT